MAEIWLSKQDAASLLGKQADFIRGQILPRMPDDGKRRASTRGNPWELRGSAVVRAYVAYLSESGMGEITAGVPSASDPLERERAARAELLEAKVAEHRGGLISVELFQLMCKAAFQPLRRFAEEQIREHGNGTADAWTDAVSEFTREVESVIGRAPNID